MARLPPISRIVKEDFPNEPWAEKLLWPLNRFMENVVSALNRTLTFNENLAAQTKQISFTTASPVGSTFPIRFSPSTPARVSDVWISSLRRADGQTMTSAFGLDWSLDNSNSVQLNYISGLDPSTSYVIRLCVLSEAS